MRKSSIRYYQRERERKRKRNKIEKRERKLKCFFLHLNKKIFNSFFREDKFFFSLLLLVRTKWVSPPRRPGQRHFSRVKNLARDRSVLFGCAFFALSILKIRQICHVTRREDWMEKRERSSVLPKRTEMM